MSYTISSNTFGKMGALMERGIPFAEVHALVEAVAHDVQTLPHITFTVEPAFEPEPACLCKRLGMPGTKCSSCRFASPACPADWDTVLGYLAKHNPFALDLIEDQCLDTQRDGWWLKHRCRERGIEPVKVAAPLFLQERGIEQVNAYPVDLLQQRLG